MAPYCQVVEEVNPCFQKVPIPYQVEALVCCRMDLLAADLGSYQEPIQCRTPLVETAAHNSSSVVAWVVLNVP
jgi:hypothetical protein